ncbi:hypothetical protein SSX86_014261 [Deinandra increscens subsp. villosa]|uniref:RING-type E3 ubiquitin transferase n=1 Tax=Deinandra increscens subsp. villosa TaxID=3103831 RepID=A0AAP0D634_9ASTR
MTRFSISEDEEEEAPLTFKRAKLSELPSQLQTSLRPSQSRFAIEEGDEDVLHEDCVPIEDVESDSEGPEEGEEVEVREDIEREDDDASDHGEAEPVSEGRNQQQPSTSSTAASLLRGNQSSTSASTFSSGEMQAVLTDPDVLDCPMCFDPLCTPVFQCENGHIACSSCCSKMERKCPSCCMPIGYNRCRAIEKVIESVKVSCKNAQYGCTKTMMYSKKNEHEQTCPHATCFCPYPSCPYVGSSQNLYLHFGIQHEASITRFTYNTPFIVYVTTNQTRMFLQERHESVIFVLNHHVKGHDRAFNVDCVGQSMLKTCFTYQLTTNTMDASDATLFLQCVPEIYAKWSEHTLKKYYLTVPSHFMGSNGILSLHVCIKKAISASLV